MLEGSDTFFDDEDDDVDILTIRHSQIHHHQPKLPPIPASAPPGSIVSSGGKFDKRRVIFADISATDNANASGNPNRYVLYSTLLMRETIDMQLKFWMEQTYRWYSQLSNKSTVDNKSTATPKFLFQAKVPLK